MQVADKWEPGERAAMVKHRDNLLPPGPIEDNRDRSGPGAGDRAPVVRHPDNLRQEGDFEKRRIEEFQVRFYTYIQYIQILSVWIKYNPG